MPSQQLRACLATSLAGFIDLRGHLHGTIVQAAFDELTACIVPSLLVDAMLRRTRCSTDSTGSRQITNPDCTI
jgi:hypothetical protein